ncbi:filamentous hemagglutinin N-terminal domain-containing protein [Cyanobium sp. T1B-Tous]|uniref:two-partner secretion domain-containing protein n=1 Tax=Cyanobium sp. T1B-Tous TaxID=2823721 RepID=UPI0020CF22B6|nr:filamentous hemagglutinin N-terminal domain-containing protein [Cyanobium sp. T1B-Tous]MCP9806659.1 filamentous hemagglutinin N-terminal domain-containing protein [Cyanobium sp. T1B-Tous]
MTLHPQSSEKANRPLLSLKWGPIWRHSTRTGIAALTLSGPLLTQIAIYAQSLPTSPIVDPASTPTSFTNPNPNTLTVTTTGRSVISWGSFNIGSGNTVNFQNNGAVLNYVRGGGASQINGALNAINPIILLNNQGISVGGTASISAPSILLSTGSLMSDSISKFLTGVDYGSGLNAPLISIELNNASGPISVDGSIRSTNGGGIGLIAPFISVGPTARLESLGFRNASTGTDGVNTTVNGVVAEGSLWLGTTGLSSNAYTQPIPGMPGAPAPTLPTGFGFTQVSGRPSPQNIRLSLRATYDFERVVIGTSGARRGQFDDLFFSPNFRAANFYLYDGIEAIEEGHRQATTGGLRRTLRDAQSNQLIDDQLEATLLGLQLPPGATLLAADRVTFDANGQLVGGNLVIDSTQSLSQNFIDQFGSGAFSISVSGGQGTLTGSNGEKASYNPISGEVSWVRTIQGPPSTETVLAPGSQIPQGMGKPPSGLEGLPATTGTYVEKEGGWYHGRGSETKGPPHCPGCREVQAQTGEVTYWKGHFASSGPGQSPHFVADPKGNSVVYQLGGRYYVTTASSFFQNGQVNKPSVPTGNTFTPQVVQTVTRPGATTVVPFQESLPIRGNATPPPQGSAQSTWVQQGKAPDKTGYAPVPTPTAAPTPTMAVPSPTPLAPTLAPTAAPPTLAPTMRPTAAPTPTMAVPSPTPLAPTLAPTAAPPTLAPTMRPTAAPTPTMAVPSPTPLAPTLAPTAAPPTLAPTMRPTAAPTPTTAVPSPTPAVPTLAPTVAPTLAPSVGPTPAQDGSRAVLKPAVVRDLSGLRAAGTESQRPGLAVSYEVPRALIEANVKGGLPAQSRATLPNGSQLPAALDYDSSSQTFTIKDTTLVPLPLDVLLTMPTLTGGQGRFVLTIGQP